MKKPRAQVPHVAARTALLGFGFLALGPLACAGTDSDKGDPAGSGGTSQQATGGASQSSGGASEDLGSGGASGGAPSGGAPTGGSFAGITGGTGGQEAGSGGSAETPADSSAALDALRAWLATAPPERTDLDTESFATVPLSADDAPVAKDLIWEDLAVQIRTNRATEVENKSITLDGFTLNYETVLLGDEPPDGRSLFISMHGGGNAPAETNDQQWQNQIALAESYAPEDALWIAPRAPTDDWNMWFKDHIIPIFDRLISNMIVFEGVQPNKIYLTGYSAGGDGVYQLGPTMADRWAGAAMSAGHPNDMTPTNLRNLAFAIHVGGDDTAYDRNLVAADWGQQLDTLQAADPEGYPHQVEVHPGLPHWMDLADQPSVPFIQSYTRSVSPTRLVWRQSTLLQSRFYWLRIPEEQAVKDAEVTASIAEQTIALDGDVSSNLTLLLSDEMLDLDQEVNVTVGGTTVFNGTVSRTILAIHRTLEEREDPASTFSAELSIAP